MMILPENGSVVVIDDDPNQAKPIIDALAKKGIATTYFKGTGENEVPNEPLKNVRLAILDLQLNPMDNDEHQIATRLINVLKNIISDNNGPFMVLIWSLKDRLFGDEFRNEVKKQANSLVPVCIATLEKPKCLQSVETVKATELADSVIEEMKPRFEENDLEVIKNCIVNKFLEDKQFEATQNAVEVIEESLKNALERAGVFHLFVLWENLIRKAGYQTVNALSTTIEHSDLWEMNMRDVLKRLAKARTGQNTLSDSLFMKAALSTLSGSFSEELEYEVRKFDFPEYIKLESPFSLAKRLNNDVYKVILYMEGDAHKVRLLKNTNVYKNKDNIGYAKIASLSDGLDETEKPFIDDLISQYQNIPSLVNTKLHIELEPSKGHMPGNVYTIDISPERKKDFLPTYFDTVPEDVSNYHFVELEVSPVCDYAQMKWKKSRLLSGLVYPTAVKIKSGPFYKVLPIVMINNKKYAMVYNYLLFKALDIHDAEKRGKFWFRIKRELSQDIVAGLSGHVNRPGISFLT